MELAEATKIQKVKKKVEQEWEKETIEVKLSCGVDQDLEPYTGRADVRIRGMPNLPRYRAMLDIAYIKANDQLRFPNQRRKRNAHENFVWYGHEQLIKDLRCDVSQNPRQRASGKELKGIGHSTLYVDMDRMSIVFPQELLSAFGYDIQYQVTERNFTNEELMDFCADGVHVPGWATCLMGLMFRCTMPGLWEHGEHAPNPHKADFERLLRERRDAA